MSKATLDQLNELHGKICEWGMAKLEEEEPIQAMTEQGPVWFTKPAHSIDDPFGYEA